MSEILELCKKVIKNNGDIPSRYCNGIQCTPDNCPFKYCQPYRRTRKENLEIAQKHIQEQKGAILIMENNNQDKTLIIKIGDIVKYKTRRNPKGNWGEVIEIFECKASKEKERIGNIVIQIEGLDGTYREEVIVGDIMKAYKEK